MVAVQPNVQPLQPAMREMACPVRRCGDGAISALTAVSDPLSKEAPVILLAILLPPVAIFIKGRPIQALLCFLLMITIIGWIPAAIWAVAVVNSADSDKRIKRLERTIKDSQSKG